MGPPLTPAPGPAAALHRNGAGALREGGEETVVGGGVTEMTRDMTTQIHTGDECDMRTDNTTASWKRKTPRISDKPVGYTPSSQGTRY